MSTLTPIRLSAPLLMLLLGGCAKQLHVEQTVGPTPAAAIGDLVVFTQPIVQVDPDWGRARLPYDLLDVNGRLLLTVGRTPYDAPLRLALRPGEYVVRAKEVRGRAEDVHVRVRIDQGRTTEVFLDGSKPFPGTPPDALVRAPNGEIVGWRAVE